MAVDVRSWWVLSRHAVLAFLRNPVAAFFTIAFPLAFLVIVAAIVGDERTPDGVPVTQMLVAPFAVFGMAQASFSVLAIDTAVLRESGVLIRLRSTPVTAGTVLAARVTAAVAAALTSLLLVDAVGVTAYGVEIVWRKAPAMLLTALLGIACLTALGLALTSLTRTVLAAQTLAQGLLIPLAFISDVFIVGADLPRILSVTGSVFPLKHFARAMSETFQPGGGYGFSAGHLAVLAAWTAAGAAVAVWRFGWSPRGSAASPNRDAVAGAPAERRLSAPRDVGRPSLVTLLGGQVGYALLILRRDLLSVFFAVVFPLVLLVLFPSIFGETDTPYLLAGMTTYAVAVAGYVNLPENLAGARSHGVFRRLRASPLPGGVVVAGRAISALLVALSSAVLLSIVATAVLGVRLTATRLPAMLLAVVAGAICFSALGLAVLRLMGSARSVVPVTLGTLLPLCFASGVFVVGDVAMPGWLSTVGAVFPVRHLMEALLTATRPGATGPGLAWIHLGVMAAWTVAALAATSVGRRTRRDVP